MEKITRHRKAFYEKENDLKFGNKKLEVNNSFQSKYVSQLNFASQSISKARIIQTQTRKQSKNDTEMYCQNYNMEILQNPINYEIAPKFLANHKIDSNLRARMLDWMVEVMSSYKFNHKTYFAGVQIMDRYFQRQMQELYPTKLHIIGVVSMMIASKMQQVYPLKLKTVYEKIGHKKISQQQLVNMEERVSIVLDFKLNSWTFYDLTIAKVHILTQTLTTKRRIGSFTNITNSNYFSTPTNQQSTLKQIQQNFPLIQQTCSYLSKLICYDYEFYCSYSLNLLSDVVLKLTFETLKISWEFNGICSFTKNSPIEVEMCKEQLVQRMKKFGAKFKGMNNLKKFTKEEIVKLVEKQILSVI